MKYIDFEPLANTITVSMQIFELKAILESMQESLAKKELETILQSAEREKQAYKKYAQENS